MIMTMMTPPAMIPKHTRMTMTKVQTTRMKRSRCSDIYDNGTSKTPPDINTSSNTTHQLSDTPEQPTQQQDSRPCNHYPQIGHPNEVTSTHVSSKSSLPTKKD